MIVTKQEKLRLLKIEQEYEESLMTIEKLSNDYEKIKGRLEKREQEIKQLQHNVQFYQGEIGKYNEITMEVEAYVKEREDQIARLNNSITDYESKLKTLNNDKDSLSRTVKEKEKAFYEIKDQLKETEIERSSAKEKLETSDTQIKALAKLLEEAETIFSEQSSEITRLTESTKDLELDLFEKDHLINTKNNRIQELEREGQERQEDMLHTKNLYEELKGESEVGKLNLEQVSLQLKDRMSELEAARKELLAVNERRKEKELEFNNLTQDKRELESELIKYKADYEKLNNELQKSIDRSKELEKEKELLTTEQNRVSLELDKEKMNNHELINRIGKLKLTYEKQIKELEDASTEIILNAKEIELQIKEKDVSLEHRKQQVYGLEQKLYKIHQDQLDYAEIISKKQEQLNQILRDNEELTKEVEGLQDYAKQFESKFDNVVSENRSLVEERNQKEALVESAKLTLEKQREVSLKQSNTLANRNEKIEEQKKLIQQLLEENEKLQQSYITLSDELKDKENQYNETIQRSEMKLEEKNRIIDGLETQIIEYMIEIESAK